MAADPEDEPGCSDGRPDLGDLSINEVLAIADFVAPPELFARGSLPVIHREVEDLGRVLTAVHTALAGHATRAMEDGGRREPLIGMPGGARPFRDAPELSGHQRGVTYPVLAEVFLHGEIDPTSLDLIMHTLQETKRSANVQQGLSYVGKQRTFHHWKIVADDLQREVLSTIAGAATNPRSRGPNGGETTGPDPLGRPGGRGEPPAPDDDRAASRPWDGAAELATDPRTTHQRQLDGLTSALMGALALTDGNGLPDSDGGRPVVMVSIDYQTLAGQWGDGPARITGST